MYFQTQELTGSRFMKVLDVAFGPAIIANLSLNIAAGTVLCAPETNSIIQTTALSYLQSVNDTENGLTFVGPEGTLNFLPRTYPQTNATSETSQATFGDNAATAQHYMPHLQIIEDNTDLYTDVQVMIGTGASSQTASGTPTGTTTPQLEEAQSSASVVGALSPRVLQRSGTLFANQLDAQTLAKFLLARYDAPVPRVGSMVMNNADDANLDTMLGLDLWDRLTVQRQGPGESPFNQDSLMIQVQQELTAPTQEWKTTFVTSPYELIYSGGGFPQLATVGAAAYAASVVVAGILNAQAIVA